MIRQVNEILTRYRQSPGGMWINDRKASVYHIARHLFGEAHDRSLLPTTVESLVGATYKEGWFVRAFYYDAVACLVFVDALALDGEVVSPGTAYDTWVENVRRHREWLDQARAAQQRQTEMFAEGRRLAVEQLVPEAVRPLLGGYPHEGVVIDRRNHAKRVVPGVKCYVEFGKRHFSWDSQITGRRETVSASYYAPGEVVSRGNNQTRVRVGGVEIDVDNYRITKVLTVG